MFLVSSALLMFKNQKSSTLFSLGFRRTLSSISAFSVVRNLNLLLQGHLVFSHLLQIHARIFRMGVDQDNLIATRLIGHYPSQVALRVFHHVQNPNIFPFNAIIRVLAEEGLFFHAFFIFKILKFHSLFPNDLTFSFLIKACSQSANCQNVQQIHTHIMKSGFNNNSFVCNGLVAVYAKGVKDLDSGHKVLEEVPERATIWSWTSLIAGYAQLSQAEEALLLFLRMVTENLRPTNDTMVSVLSACSSLQIVEIERWVKILSEFCGANDFEIANHDSINTVLVYLYAKCGEIAKSREAFDRIIDGLKVSVMPWNVMICGYVQNGCPMDALNLFHVMVVRCNLRPNHVTMVSILSACAQVGDLDLGILVHNYVKDNGCKGIIESNRYLATAFIDMYSNCGSLDRAKDVFHQMVVKDVISFNTMIMGLAINGKGDEALKLFLRMREFGLLPNSVTFLGLLSACNHSGLVQEGRQIFRNMELRYSISPKLEHYASYVDLLARAGYVEEAWEVVSSMPIKPNGLVWGALLGGCLVHSRIDLACDAAKHLTEVEPDNPAGYILLSNAHAADHRWGKIAELRGSINNRRVRKQPGCSWISINGVMHEFHVGSTSDPQAGKISDILDRLLKDMKSHGP